MANFVLVHGAWHGGWCWHKVAALLRQAGHEVYTPTLTGLGERSHLLNREIDLNTHILDLTQVLEFEDLTQVILVGHSSGGMVISGAAERAAARIARLVYLDAFIPANNQAIFDILPVLETNFEQAANAGGDGWLVPAFAPERWGVTDPSEVAWMQRLLRPTPLQIFKQKVALHDAQAINLPRSFIWCSQFGSFKPMAEQAKAAGWDYHEIATGHDAMLTAPEQLAQILLKL